MSFPMDERVLALAGVAQCLREVRRVAETGQSDAAVVRTAMESVFRIDADSPAAVYGRASDVAPGLKLLSDYLGNRGQDVALPRLALAVLQLERRFTRTAGTAHAVGQGVSRIAEQARTLGDPAHPDVLSALGRLYTDTVSQLRPRIMVQGNPHYLGQAGVVSEIRALLMAALRSAVLWRQLGGNLWDFLFLRRAMGEAIARQLR
ncbi:high frequency lysogenization protein HflD [Xanthomonas massiliensis]|jgi:high frequency lysogenization protein|uniref:high frequency lysogenization protein HflD n=1 Tax=Xanthomonas massiliensis TaxID=1720302 RepID=UPI000824AE07|nr:high frequency lysogenization protein HflD [Xanthomonas massiliensis]